MTVIAEDLQDGATLAALATRYAVTERMLTGRLRDAGYRPDGSVIGRERSAWRPRPLIESDTGSMHYVAGGDYESLPTTPVRHRLSRPKPTGLDWSKHTAPDPAPAPAVRHVVLQGNGHSFREAQPGEYDETLGAVGPAKPRRARAFKLDGTRAAEAARRYAAGEGTYAIAEAVGATPNQVHGALQRQGVQLRSRREAQKLRWSK
jgi:hypothetical protein